MVTNTFLVGNVLDLMQVMLDLTSTTAAGELADLMVNFIQVAKVLQQVNGFTLLGAKRAA